MAILSLQRSADAADAVVVAAAGELESDAAGRQFVQPPPGVNELEHHDQQSQGPPRGGVGAVFKGVNTACPVAVALFSQGGADDPASAATWAMGRT